MFGGQDGLRRLMSQDTLKPKRLGDTLRRFGRYFKAYWPILILVLERGQIVAQGKHTDLLEDSELYAEIYNSQLVGDVTGEAELELETAV